MEQVRPTVINTGSTATAQSASADSLPSSAGAGQASPTPVETKPPERPYKIKNGINHEIRDHFIGQGKLLTKTSNETISVDRWGRLFQKVKDDYYKVGQMYTDGRFQFSNGFSGNAMNSMFFKLNTYRLSDDFGKELQKTWDHWVGQASETPHLRQHLHSQGINGQGVGVAALESEGSYKGYHLASVKHVINNPDHGYAPGAEVSLQHINKTKDIKIDLVYELDQLPNALENFLSDVLEPINDSFEYKLAHPEEASERIITMSFGNTLIEVAKHLQGPLDQKLNEEFEAIEARHMILGPDHATLSKAETQERLVEYVANFAQHSTRFQNNMTRYQELTQQLTEAGKIITVSMANNNDSVEPGATIDNSAQINFLGLSDHVIRVAASDNNQTPGDTSDDQVTHFSSRGDGRFNPTITTTGERVKLDKYYNGYNGAFNGTSAATPIVASTVAMMLQQNPNLKHHDVVRILQSTATNTTATNQEEGGGMMNTVQAVQKAVQQVNVSV